MLVCSTVLTCFKSIFKFPPYLLQKHAILCEILKHLLIFNEEIGRNFLLPFFNFTVVKIQLKIDIIEKWQRIRFRRTFVIVISAKNPGEIGKLSLPDRQNPLEYTLNGRFCLPAASHPNPGWFVALGKVRTEDVYCAGPNHGAVSSFVRQVRCHR